MSEIPATMMLVTGRVCLWCQTHLPNSRRADAVVCSASCRKRISRFRVELGSAHETSGGLTGHVAFAELPHERRDGGSSLVRALHSEVAGLDAILGALTSHDRWALALPARFVDAAAQILPEASVSYVQRTGDNTPVDAVLFSAVAESESRPSPLLLNTRVADRQRPTMHKPAAFWRWLFVAMDVRRGDEFIDVYPGESGGAKAFKIYAQRTEEIRP